MLLFLTINKAVVTSRTGCLAVLFWSGRVRMSGVPPPPPFQKKHQIQIQRISRDEIHFWILRSTWKFK